MMRRLWTCVMAAVLVAACALPAAAQPGIVVTPAPYISAAGVAKGGIAIPDFIRLSTANTTAPAAGDCDAAAEVGRHYWDSTNDKYYVCSGASGWIQTGGIGAVSMIYPGAGLPVSTGSAWGTSLSSTAPIFTASVTAGAIATQSVVKLQGTTDATPFTFTIAAPDLSADHALTLANGDTTLVSGTMLSIRARQIAFPSRCPTAIQIPRHGHTFSSRVTLAHTAIWVTITTR